MVSYLIQDGGQNCTEGEIKLVEGLKMVLLMHCFHLIVLISKQEKLKYLIVNRKITH